MHFNFTLEFNFNPTGFRQRHKDKIEHLAGGITGQNPMLMGLTKMFLNRKNGSSSTSTKTFSATDIIVDLPRKIADTIKASTDKTSPKFNLVKVETDRGQDVTEFYDMNEFDDTMAKRVAKLVH